MYKEVHNHDKRILSEIKTKMVRRLKLLHSQYNLHNSQYMNSMSFMYYLCDNTETQ